MALTFFQFAVSLLAWGLLAFSFSRFFHSPPLRFLAFGILLLFSGNLMIIPWDGVIMTESLNFSLFALAIALWFLYLRQASWPVALSLLAASSLWTFLRESNAWLVLMVGGVLLILWLLRRGNFQLIAGIALCSAFLANYLLGGISGGMDQPWVFPLLNVIGKKMLKNDQRVEWFREHGMPVSPALMEMNGEYANGRGFFFYTSPELGSFRDWLIRDGRRTYMLFLIEDPRYLLLRPFDDLTYLATNENDDSYQPATFQPMLPPALNRSMVWDINPTGLVILGLLAAGVSVLMLLLRRNGFWLILAMLILLFFPHLILVWHGDAMGTSRHSLLANIQIRLAIWMILLAAADEILLKARTALAQKG